MTPVFFFDAYSDMCMRLWLAFDDSGRKDKVANNQYRFVQTRRLI